MKIKSEFVVCPDCAIVIANSDTSGLEDAEAHLARMDATITEPVIIDRESDRGFFAATCGACGTHTATDQWFDAVTFEEN
jgi:hypothetical protein